MTTTVGIPLAVVRRTSDLSLATATPTAVAFQVADYDYSTPGWDVGSPSKYTVAAGLHGYYMVSAEVGFHCPTTPTFETQRKLSLRVNGIATPEVFREAFSSIPAAVDTQLVTHGFFYLNDGDYIELIARQDSTGDGTVTGARMTVASLVTGV